MPSKLITLPEIFAGKILRIPDYQRGYSWAIKKETKQMNDLWVDLQNIENSPHFMGIITLEKISKGTLGRWQREFGNIDEELRIQFGGDERTPYFVVDGQQRLVSLTILLFLLSKDPDALNHGQTITNMLANSENGQHCYNFGYEVDTPSHQYLIGKILEDVSMEVTEPETLYTRNLDRAKDFFLKKLSEINSFQKRDLCQKLLSQLYFNVLIVDGESLDISLIFETLNYRGKPLSKLELFKNRLIYLVTKRYSGDNAQTATRFRKKITRTWLDIYEWLGKNPAVELDDDDFLRAFWIMFYDHTDRKDSEFEQFEQDIFEKKYTITNISRNDLLSADRINKLLDTLSDSVKYWFFMHFPDHNFTTEDDLSCFAYSDEIKELLKKIFRIRSGQFLKPMILSYFLKVELEHQEKIQDLLDKIERHNYCVYYFAGHRADTNRAYFSRMINQVLIGNCNHEKLTYELSDYTEKWVKWADVFDHIHQNRANNQRFYDWNGLKYTLWEWEESLRGDGERLIKKFDGAQIYQIYQDNYHDGFPIRGKRERKEKLRCSLGNISIGRSARRPQPFPELKNNLAQGGYCEQNIAKNFDESEWTDKDIWSRGQKLLDFIEIRWKIHYTDLKEDELQLRRRQLLLDGVIIGDDEKA
jgi:hypothetical protein